MTQSTHLPTGRGNEPPLTQATREAPGTGEAVPVWQRVPLVPLVFTALLASVTLCPLVSEPALRWSVLGAAGVLLAWELALLALHMSGRGMSRAFRMEFAAVPSHYVQGFVQGSLLVYWGWFAREVYAEAPLILAQLFYLYCLEALFTWSRGRTWRLGFGPLPIVLSTNLLLWFKHDYYYLQFAMLTAGALGKQFITWERDRMAGPAPSAGPAVGPAGGRRTHIFNPSAFGQALFAVGLIATGLTSELTWGERIASTFEVPHMLVVIFVGGLIVQSLFHVTLMTMAAVATIYAFNLAYTEATGVYYFVNVNIAASIFLGVHLLVTDPATSPRTYVGRIVFGILYGMGYLIAYALLRNAGVPTFWDKLLPVPFLNLCVPLIERATRIGPLGRVDRLWASALPRRWLNVVHMACWAALFSTMVATGFIEAPHPGNSIPFWKQAMADGRPGAARGYLVATGAQADGLGIPDAKNELGVIAIEGTLEGVTKSDRRAAHLFAQASEAGSIHGSMNVALQFLFFRMARSEQDAIRALDHLERSCGTYPDANACYLVGYAYETGRGRPQDRARAIGMYERCGELNPYAMRGLARLALVPVPPVYDPSPIVPVLQRAAAAGDDECHWYLAYMYDNGVGVPRDAGRSRVHLQQACQLGLKQACEAAALPTLPPFAKPVMHVPGWSSAYPAVMPANVRSVAR